MSDDKEFLAKAKRLFETNPKAAKETVRIKVRASIKVEDTPFWGPRESKISELCQYCENWGCDGYYRRDARKACITFRRWKSGELILEKAISLKQGQHTRHEKQDPLRNQLYDLIQDSFPGRLDDWMVRTAIGTACYIYARGIIDRDQLIADIEYALCYDRKHWPKEFWAEFGEIERKWNDRQETRVRVRRRRGRSIIWFISSCLNLDNEPTSSRRAKFGIGLLHTYIDTV